MPKPYDKFAERGDGGLSVTTVREKTVYRAKKYIGLVTTHDDDGNAVKRPKYITGQGDTRQAAKKNLSKNLERFYRLAEEERLLPRAQRELTLAAYWYDSWLPAAQASERRKTEESLGTARRAMEMHALPALGTKPLRDLRPTDVKTLLELTLPNKGLGAAGIINVRKTLSAVLTDALSEGKLLVHPMARLKCRTKPPKRKVEAPRGLVDALRAEVKGTQEECRWMLALLLAVRPGETLGLKWDAIEGVLEGDDAPSLYVRRQLKWKAASHAPACRRRPDGKAWTCGKSSAKCTLWENPTDGGKGRLYLEESTKNDPIRIIPVTEPLITLLREQHARQQTWRKANPEAWARVEAERPDLRGLVFTTQDGKPRRQQVDGDALKDILARLRKKGVEADFTPHGARHIAITQFALSGLSTQVAQAIAGHMDPRMQETYTHLRSDDLRDAISRIGEDGVKAYKALEAAKADDAREAKRQEAAAAKQKAEDAYLAWKADRTGNDGRVRFDPRTDPHPPLPLWEARWMPNEVAAALSQPGVKQEALGLFKSDLMLEEIARFAPLGATDPAQVRKVADLPDEFLRGVFD